MMIDDIIIICKKGLNVLYNLITKKTIFHHKWHRFHLLWFFFFFVMFVCLF